MEQEITPIYTVTIDSDGCLSNVSFMTFDDAVKYIIEEIKVRKPLTEEEVQDVSMFLNEEWYFDNDDGLVFHIDESSLIKNFQHL